jgi:hypothetical protein
LNVIPSMAGVRPVLIVVVLEFPKKAVPLGTEPVDQFAPEVKLLDDGLASHVASCARASIDSMQVAAISAAVSRLLNPSTAISLGTLFSA